MIQAKLKEYATRSQAIKDALNNNNNKAATPTAQIPLNNTNNHIIPPTNNTNWNPPTNTIQFQPPPQPQSRPLEPLEQQYNIPYQQQVICHLLF